MMTVFVREEDSKRRIVLRNGVSLRYQKMGKTYGCTKSRLLHHRCNGFFLNDSELSVCCTGGSMVQINSVVEIWSHFRRGIVYQIMYFIGTFGKLSTCL